MGTAVSLDPFADMAPLMPEPSLPAADLASAAEALQPGRTTGEAVAVAIPVAAGPSSPSGGSDDGFGSFNEASGPGSLFLTSMAAAPGGSLLHPPVSVQHRWWLPVAYGTVMEAW